jgi:hypothetical protein
MSFDPLDYLRHIKVEVDYLQVSCAGGSVPGLDYLKIFLCL